MNCEVRGDPLPTIQWSKSGINIQISNRIRQLDNGSLAIYGTVVRRDKRLRLYCVDVYIVFGIMNWVLFVFNSLQGEDAGNYMCVATNDAGVVERSVTLTLQSKCLSAL